MYTRIKELADSAVALQNKINMEAALREISGICDIVASESAALDPVGDDKPGPVGGFVSGEVAKPVPAKKAAKK